MKTTNECPKCHSTKIAQNLRVRYVGSMGDGAMSVSSVGNIYMSSVKLIPKKNIFGKIYHDEERSSRNIKAWVCGDCGYLEMYIENPTEFYNRLIFPVELQFKHY